ncbi:replication-relaxation family protein [Bradyrhizobium liaoningense]|uniref:replication-relaxation family protein n=1 Tax=Bradyrhizobium liaoningense TaxID=43992 RepID=UPI0004BC402F|nr:replication-relaxation family protein [Bradyrhizobium liaoningense]
MKAIKPDVPGDIEILKAVGRHSLLLPDDLCAITNRSYSSIISRTKKLKDHGYVRWTDAQDKNRAAWLSFPKAFQLTNKGVGKLMEIGCDYRLPESSKQFLHQLTESQVAASFEIGARERLVTHKQILSSPNTPQKASGHFPVAFHFKGKDYDYKLKPDVGPLGIKYPNGTYRFLVVEVDLASEPLISANRDRQAIETKIAGYLNVLEQQIFHTQFGLPNLSVLFTSTNQVRVKNIIDLCGVMAGKFASRFAAQVVPTITSGAKPPMAGYAVNRPWLQPGGKTLNIGEA